MKIVFLGTGGMVPTKDRNVQSTYLEYRGEGILMDCGEGTQRQMNLAGINRIKVRKILISHWHGDHVAGLIGLVQTLGNIDQPGTVKLYGPEGTKDYLDHMLKCCSFDMRLDLQVQEIRPEDDEPVTFFENDRYELQAVRLRHSTPCLGYAFVEKDQRNISMAKAKGYGLEEGPALGRLQKGETVEKDGNTIRPDDVSTIKKGRKVSFALDTEPCPGLNNLARDADVFIAEATYESSLDEKAEEYKHLTAQVVAQVASQENVKRLYLTHFSQRYKTPEKLEEDARKVFPDTVCAYDFLQIKL
ncbi:ribonuclease Z [Candidatus Woesearchaeota archaeon]|nr:ribonuclease Z [Candidatus Woesearchaeota archaeon]